MPGSSGDGSVPMAHADAGADRFRRLFELHTDAILLVEDGTGRVLDVNAAAERLYGYTGTELLRVQATDLAAKAGEVTEQWSLHPGLSREMPQTRFQRKKDGTVFPAEVSEHAFVDRGRTFHFSVIRDMSERWPRRARPPGE